MKKTNCSLRSLHRNFPHSISVGKFRELSPLGIFGPRPCLGVLANYKSSFKICEWMDKHWHGNRGSADQGC